MYDYVVYVVTIEVENKCIVNNLANARADLHRTYSIFFLYSVWMTYKCYVIVYAVLFGKYFTPF